VSGFRAFLMRGNVVDLAVAVVIGAAFGAVVQALIKDIITAVASGPAETASPEAERHPGRSLA